MTLASILLVDDLEENLISLEALLRRDNLVLLKARSGDEALELLLKNDVALALVDVQMPGLNGFELAELMRGNERSKRVPIIFVTAGSADYQRRFQGYEAGAVDFIQKPIEPGILRSKADVFLELYRQRQQIAAQRDELIVNAEALSEADRRKDQFLATLAHELRNPLAPLRAGLDVLKREPDTESLAEIRNTMDRQLNHLVRLIDDLMDVSRVRQGKIELRKERIQVGEAVRAAVEAVLPYIEADKHSLSVVLPEEELWIDADLTRLSQVVANLLNNAAKYTPPEGRISLSVRKEAGDLIIEVSDSGIGIPAEMQSKVFQLFMQLDDPRGRTKGGLGIGLALVEQLVGLHGGSISAYSAGEGQGSKFSIRLPLAEMLHHAVPKDGAGEEILSRTRSRKVLVVDDDKDVARAVGWMLEEIGHDYLILNDERLALDEARSYEPDIILLDIGLPHMDGYEVCRLFRRDPQFKMLPIIAQTGWGQSKDKERASEAGFSDHLTKPVSIDDLERLISTVTSA
ncbi:response regulator [Hyphomicrobium sp.]|uniref:ATP-binding response regulator n=1 Tax=Hyphomicrobium sp. TaxID=82 RepID=UPI002C7B4A94|nr:response regulator [Hyphomicrobium sp.]HRN87176.1 response regulator [Hyphomicrobium sp.]HRQ25776.1 response regulator [Hyphomicrobium sp.]